MQSDDERSNMFERDGYPAGVPCWVDTSQPDPDAAAEFYGGLFGWEFEDRMPTGAPGRYLIAQLRGRDVAAVGSPPEGSPPAPVWSTYVWVESADETAAKVKDAGGQVVTDPFDVLDAGRMAVFADPEGASFCIWEAREHRGAVLVNEPGTWNFSELNTRDPERAATFYGAVFGWEVETMEMEGTGFTFFRMPGYGDFLSASNPELRGSQESLGAPEGFADAVAWLIPMTSDQFPAEMPAHWSITFAVDDTDAAAARAAELGGTVTAPPFDAPPVRMAAINDPQGAAFTVSKYTPPTN